MELAELGKKALFVPTPGQTEQMYLAQRYKNLGWFHSVSQQELDLKRDTGTAASCSGIPHSFSTAETLSMILPLLTGAVPD
jgi:predicted glycosyltransferase